MSGERPAFARLRRGHARVRVKAANDGGRGAMRPRKRESRSGAEGPPRVNKDARVIE